MSKPKDKPDPGQKAAFDHFWHMMIQKVLEGWRKEERTKKEEESRDSNTNQQSNPDSEMPPET